MQGRWWGLLVFIALVNINTPCLADECRGKLQRVDRNSITLRVKSGPLVLRVDPDLRKQAAPYLGKSVTVSFEPQNGEIRALVLQTCQ